MEQEKVEVLNQSNNSNPLYGVGGWLKFFIIVNLYLAPIFFVIQYGLAWYGFTVIAEEHPNIYLSGSIETIAKIILLILGIKAAISLRDIEIGAVQKVRFLLKLALGWTILSVPVSLISGLDTDVLMPEIIKGVVLGLIGFAIWYSYFNVSVRVKLTYPDSEMEITQ